MEIIHIGKHKVTHNDLMKVNLKRDFLNGEIVDFMYSDPPWGTGNLKYWQTINKRMTGASKNEVDLEEFLNRIFDLTNNVRKMVFIEYGIRWKERILQRADYFGLFHIDTIELVYNSNNLPLDLHIFSKAPIALPKGYREAVYHTKGQESLKQAITPFVKPGETIFDPCCGMGYTAQFAVNNGMTFRGNELNMARLKKTIARLEKDPLK